MFLCIIDNFTVKYHQISGGGGGVKKKIMYVIYVILL